MRDWLFITSILSVYLMRWLKHFEVKGSWSSQWLMQLNCLWGRETSQTIPIHKTEIKPSKKSYSFYPHEHTNCWLSANWQNVLQRFSNKAHHSIVKGVGREGLLKTLYLPSTEKGKKIKVSGKSLKMPELIMWSPLSNF